MTTHAEPAPLIATGDPRVFTGGGAIRCWQTLRRDPLALFSAMAAEGDVVGARVAYKRLVLVNSPAGIRRVLTEPGLYRRDVGSVAVLRRWLGPSPLTTNDGEWSAQRRAMEVSLREGAEAKIEATAARVAADAVARVGAGATLEVARWSMALTYRASMAALFGWEADADEARGFVDDFLAVQVGLFQNLVDGVPGLHLWPLPRNAQIRAGMGRIRGLARRIAAAADPATPLGAALHGSRGGGCPLHALIGGGAKSRACEDYVVGFLAAAPENPSNTIAWALELLTRHPQVLARVVEELDAALADGSPPTRATLERAPYFQATLQEVMRLYPGAWAFERRATVDDVVDGRRIERGDVVVLSPYLLHRSPALWQDPDAFHPERFLDARPRRGAFMPFGIGPRHCVGLRLAQLEVATMLAVLLRRLRFERADPAPARPWPLFTLRIRDGLWLRARPRVEISSAASG